jgi:hypothetical protein
MKTTISRHDFLKASAPAAGAGLTAPFSLSRALAVVAIFLAGCLAAPPTSSAETNSVTFDKPVSTHEWTLKELNPDLPSDWTGYNFLVVEFRTSSSQRFELGLKMSPKSVSKRIHPFPGVWVRASIPLRFYRQGLGNGSDLAATVNQPRNSYWINIEAGGFGPTTNVEGMSVTMRYPAGSPTLEIRSVTLATNDSGDDVLEGKPLIDEFGQYVHAEWPGKAHTEADLKTAWAAESDALKQNAAFADRDAYGGFASTKAKATGFFRVEQIDGRWWFVDPDGHLFYSTGVNGIGVGSGTRITGREDYFATIPKPLPGYTNVFGGGRAGGRQANFYGANIQRRYGDDWRTNWAQLTAQRMDAWGLNTSYGTGLSEVLDKTPLNKPYVVTLRGFQTGDLIMGLPDVYATNFQEQVEAVAARQLTTHKNDPYLLGYFIGNEPPWPGRESQFVDLVLQGEHSEMQKHFKAALAKGDTPDRRRQLVLDAFARYLAVINAAVKKADPNHLNLGIRFGGTPPDYVIKLAKDFDVYSLNKYSWEPSPGYLEKIYSLVDKPMLIGEFHIGVPGRGMAPGLVQAMNQQERGIAYQYYVEHAAAHPEVIGTHWFQWIDEPVTGRPDGENYNIGWVDVTDRPYNELVATAKFTHARLLDIHSGKITPTDRMARASETGTPAAASQLGIPAIQ